MKNTTIFSLFAMVSTSVLLLTGCETMNQIAELGTSIAVSSGSINQDQADSINRSARAVGKAFENLTPEQEYYVGRSVAATIFEQYKAYDNRRLTYYVNTLGQSLSGFSTLPETFGGYHFAVLDSDELNAFAAPGGLILVTRGLVNVCKNEDQLAAVLAHEIGHVQNKDGLRAIKSSRWSSVGSILLTESAKNLGSAELAELSTTLEGSVDDIIRTVAVNGYSRRQEYQADEAAIDIMQQMGYDPHALVDMLNEMDKQWEPGGLGFEKTHPSPQDRIAQINTHLNNRVTSIPLPQRTARFKRAVN